MANWKELVTADSNGTISHHTTGAANGLANGVVLQLGQGGTGSSDLSAGLLVKSSDGLQTLAPEANKLMYNNGEGGLQWKEINDHVHDDYMEKAAANFTGGNLEMTGDLIVGGNIQATAMQVASTTATKYVLNHGTSHADGEEYGLIVQDSAGTAGDAGLVYKADADVDVNGGKWYLRHGTGEGSIDREIAAVITSAGDTDGTPTANASEHATGTICAQTTDNSLWICV